MRDVTPAISLKAEIVSDIPVKNPLGETAQAKTQSASSPVAKIFKPSNVSGDSLEDKELDHILRDVNSSVKKAETSVEARFEHLSGVHKKAAVKKAKLEEARNGSPPIVATLVACLVGLGLVAAAFLVYRNGY